MPTIRVSQETYDMIKRFADGRSMDDAINRLMNNYESILPGDENGNA